ncbi:ferric reductase-like transmembrane domain-containing protein [Desulfosarcina variabilis]|uniref:ferredoxin reductase family protein n=1 Tax=Desulfosarcina variabilis TaxID=2300 RepID=UPI003AFA997B
MNSISAKILPANIRATVAIAIILLAVLLLAAALTVPYLFESPSMWYKFGMDKTSLRVGKMLGLAAGVLILLQLPLAGRFKFLDRVFSMPGLIRQHRMHAWAIAALALAHPAFVLYSEKKWLIPWEIRYWPEWVGGGLLIMILLVLVASYWRKRMGLAFHVWAPLHRFGGLLILVLLIAHVLYVSESFTDNLIPRLAVMVAATILALAWLWVRSGWIRASRRPYQVTRVETGAADAITVTLSPLSDKPFAYVPGQFAIVRFKSPQLSSEPHPFTLSSSPSRGADLQFTIRACGDWTRGVNRLQSGDRALVQGPFGRFGHLFLSPDRELIMIAGGIGITPMLSMLRYMADKNDPRRITLIWSNRTPQHMVFADEMDILSAKLTGLRLIPMFTRNTDSNSNAGRMDRRRLETMIRDHNRKAAVFVCGPPLMMKQITTDLKALGFPSRFIHTEIFGY